MIYEIKLQSGEVVGRLELADDLYVEAAQATPSTPPPPPEVEEVKVMTAKAGTFSYEQYAASGWSDSMLVAQGLMEIHTEPVQGTQEAAQDNGAAIHPSVAQQDLGEEWQTHQAPPVPEAPKAPEVPPVPEAPEAPAAPQAPGVPPAPQPQEQTEAPSQDGIPEGCSWLEGEVPRIPGREFMIRDISYEALVDADGALFDGRIHGQTKLESGQEVPATRKDGTFKKKRGVEAGLYAEILNQQKQAAPAAPEAPQPYAQAEQGEALGWAPGGEPPKAPEAPPAPPAPGTPPPPPSPSGAPQPPNTAPEAPDYIEQLESALKDWGDEV